MASDVNIFSVG